MDVGNSVEVSSEEWHYSWTIAIIVSLGFLFITLGVVFGSVTCIYSYVYYCTLTMTSATYDVRYF